MVVVHLFTMLVRYAHWVAWIQAMQIMIPFPHEIQKAMNGTFENGISMLRRNFWFLYWLQMADHVFITVFSNVAS